MELAYLFRAYFEDGDCYTQSPDDAATIAPSGSAFSDVLHLQAQGKRLTAFALVPAGQDEPLAAVHLDTGHFELGGHEFWIGEPQETPGDLIYHRVVRRTRTQDFEVVSGEAVGDWHEAVHVRYVIGCGHHTIGLDG